MKKKILVVHDEPNLFDSLRLAELHLAERPSRWREVRGEGGA